MFLTLVHIPQCSPSPWPCCSAYTSLQSPESWAPLSSQRGLESSPEPLTSSHQLFSSTASGIIFFTLKALVHYGLDSSKSSQHPQAIDILCSSSSCPLCSNYPIYHFFPDSVLVTPSCLHAMWQGLVNYSIN